MNDLTQYATRLGVRETADMVTLREQFERAATRLEQGAILRQYLSAGKKIAQHDVRMQIGIELLHADLASQKQLRSSLEGSLTYILAMLRHPDELILQIEQSTIRDIRAVCDLLLKS